MLLDSKGRIVAWVYCRLRQKTPISCKFEQSFVCLDKLLARPLLVGSPTLSFEAEEPGDQSRSLGRGTKPRRGHVGAGDQPAGFGLVSISSSLSFAVSAVATFEEQDAGRKIEAPQPSSASLPPQGSLKVSKLIVAEPDFAHENTQPHSPRFS